MAILHFDHAEMNFQQQDTFYRLIDTSHRQCTLLESLLEGSHDTCNKVRCIGAFDHIVSGDDREHRSLTEGPLLADATHVEAVGDHDTVITQLGAQDTIDGSG